MYSINYIYCALFNFYPMLKFEVLQITQLHKYYGQHFCAFYILFWIIS